MAYRFEKLGKDTMIAVSDEHTFGTDAFLLADFCGARHKDRVCDIGTGCGIIAVLIKLRYSPADITGIDIQPQAIDQFRLTVEKSGFPDVHPLLCDVRCLDKTYNGVFDLVVSNPPYKAANSGIESESASDKIARHETMLSVAELCTSAAKMLRFGGRFCMCCRPERLADTVCAMRENGIEPKRLRFVQKNSSSAPWLFLIEGRKGGKPFLQVEPALFMYSGDALNKNYLSEEMKTIYGNFAAAEVC
ncbi:MAG: methyltransferase [Oscillospiraceae bacterium]|nr:methyltransferase [Oscillospiraceae bacterium]